MSKYKKLLSDTVVFALGSFGSKMILFFLMPLYTNCLSTAQYGTVELIDTFANLLIPFVSMVIFDAVLRFSLDKTKDKKSVILNAYIVLAIGSMITLFVTPLFGLYDSVSKWKWFITLYVIVYMITQVNLTYIKANDNSKLFVLLGLSQTVILAALNIVLLLFFKLEIYGYLISNIAAQLIIALVAAYKGNIISDIRQAHFDKGLLKEMVKYSSPLILNNISWWVISSSDKMMVELFVGSAALGLYSVANKIPALINVITSFFSQAWGISSIKEYDSDKDTSFYSQIFTIYSFVIFLFCSCLLIIIKPFMHIYVAENFFEAWRFTPFLLVAASFSAISAYFGAVYGALKKSVNVMISTVLSGTINVVLNFALIPSMGVLGATLATAVSYLFIAIYRMHDTRRYFKFTIHFGLFYIESILLLVDAYCVVFEKQGLAVSIITALLMLLLNIKTIKPLLHQIKQTVAQKGK